MAEEEKQQIDDSEENETILLDGETEFNDALRLGNLETAEKLLAEYKINNGETAFYSYRLALLDEKRGELKAAYITFKKLYFENPVLMMGRNDYTRMVQLYLKDPYTDIDKEIKRAQADFFKELDKKRLELSQKGENPATVPESKPFEFWRLNAQLFNSVVERLESLIEFEPNELEVLKLLLRLYTEKKDEEQISWFKERIKDSSKIWKEFLAKRSLAALNQASKLEAVSKFETAIDVVNLGLETEPFNLDLLIFKTEVLQKMGCLKEALACAIGVLKEDQHNSQAFRLKKSLEFQIVEDNVNIGIELLTKAEQDSPNSPAQISKVRSAYSLLLEAIGYDDENLIALAGIYRCNIRMGEPLKAQKVLERIRAIDGSFDPYSIFKESKRSGDESSNCFVATRVFGATHKNTIFLRKFRDSVLKKYLLGRIFIKVYKNIGPRVAFLPQGSPVLFISSKGVKFFVQLLKKVYS